MVLQAASAVKAVTRWLLTHHPSADHGSSAPLRFAFFSCRGATIQGDNPHAAVTSSQRFASGLELNRSSYSRQAFSTRSRPAETTPVSAARAEITKVGLMESAGAVRGCVRNLNTKTLPLLP